MLYLLFILGFIIRLILIPHPGFEADMAYWKGWGLAVSDKGLFWLIKNTNYNYPPAFAYVLYIVNKVYALFQNPYDINSYWASTNIFYLFLIKSITILSDFGIVVILIKIGKKLGSKLGIIAAIVYFLHPAVIFDGSLWGQVDQYGLFLFLLAVYFLLEDNLIIASSFITISYMMKIQNILFIPLFFLYIYKKYDYSGLIKSLIYSAVAFFIITLPFLIHREYEVLIKLMIINADWFQYFSLNAFNIWWIKSGLDGMGISDRNFIFGITSAKQLGLYLFIPAYFTGFVGLFFSKKADIFKRFIIACSIAMFAFFHLLTESHERYLFPVLGLLSILIMLEDKKTVVKTWILFGLISLFLFLNMYIGMYFNYPAAVFWPFSKQITLMITLIVSIIQIGLFGWFFVRFVGRDYRKNWVYNIGLLSVIIGLLFFQNSHFLLQKPVSLTKIKPIRQSQDFGSPVVNMTVNSQFGPSQWARLSDNYFFYDTGLGSHADSVIEYSLQKKFSKFRSAYGIDTEGGTDAKVYFAVYGDGRELFISETMGRFDSPKTASVSIKGVDILSLYIKRVGASNNGAHADWLDPIIIK